MIILRKNTISDFDLCKKKNTIDFERLGFGEGIYPIKIACSFAQTKEVDGIEIKKSKYNISKRFNTGHFIWNTASDACICRLPRLLTQQGLTTIERVDDAG